MKFFDKLTGYFNKLFKGKLRSEPSIPDHVVIYGTFRHYIRKLRHKAKRGIDEAGLRLGEYDHLRLKTWEKARELLKTGYKADAIEALKKYRVIDFVVHQFYKKLLLLNSYVILELKKICDGAYQLVGAKLIFYCYENSETLESLDSVISKIIESDPSKILATSEGVQDRLNEQTEIDEIFDQVFGEKTRGDRVPIPTVDELVTKLEKELREEPPVEPQPLPTSPDESPSEAANGSERSL